MPESMEDLLRRHMKPAHAPDTLWRRVVAPGPRVKHNFRWVLWPAVAGLVLLASSEVRYHAQAPTVSRTWVRNAAAAKLTHDVCLQCHTDRL